MRTRAGVSVAGLAVVLALVAASPAVATRYVSPTGGATDCAVTAPCSITRAMAVAGSGEEIIVAQGDYQVSAAPSSNACTGPREPSFDNATALGVGNRYIHGVAGRPRPRLIGDASTCVVLTVCCNGSAEHLEVISNNTSKAEAAAVLVDGNGNVSDVVTGGANGTVHM